MYMVDLSLSLYLCIGRGIPMYITHFSYRNFKLMVLAIRESHAVTAQWDDETTATQKAPDSI